MQKTTPERLCRDLMDVAIEKHYPYYEDSLCAKLYFMREQPGAFSVSFDFTQSSYELMKEISFLKKRKARLMKENQKLEDEARKINDYIREKGASAPHLLQIIP